MESDLHDLDQVPPLAARLRAAREARGLTQAQAAVELGVSRPLLIAMEKGSREVQPAELVKLATIYGKPVAELLRPTEPPASIRAKFRTGLSATANGDLLESAVAELEESADNYLDLLNRASTKPPGRQPPVRSLEHVSVEQAGEELAVEERNRLGLGDGPIQALREVLEIEVGLRIFFLQLPSKIAGLFIYVSPLGGCVAVNKKHPLERRRWTMAHEYAHFLASRDRPEVTELRPGRRLPDGERFADSFAANFLMPRNGIVRRFHELFRANGRFTPASLVQLAHSYRVSVQALCLRLEGLGLVSVGTWDRLKEHDFQPRRAAQKLNLPVVAGSDDPLPFHYRTLAAQLLIDGDITEMQFAHYLGRDIVSARRELERLTSTGDVGEDGTPQIINLQDSVG